MGIGGGEAWVGNGRVGAETDDHGSLMKVRVRSHQTGLALSQAICRFFINTNLQYAWTSRQISDEILRLGFLVQPNTSGATL